MSTLIFLQVLNFMANSSIVYIHYKWFKQLIYSKHEKKTMPVSGPFLFFCKIVSRKRNPWAGQVGSIKLMSD